MVEDRVKSCCVVEVETRWDIFRGLWTLQVDGFLVGVRWKT